jgi:hypothetical protein
MKLINSEQIIQNQILDFLNFNKIFCFRVNNVGIYDEKNKIYRTPSKFSLKGVSDIVGILPNGKFLSIEVKTAKGVVSIEQKAFINKINSMNGLSFVARSIEDVKNELKEYL